MDYRSFDTHDEGKALAAELVRLKVDLIVAQAPPALLAARSATQSVPIVTFFVGDPVRMGIVPSLARPGGNITGFTWDAGAEATGQSLQVTKELFPKARRLGLLWNQENDTGPFYAREFESHASSLGLALVSVGVRAPEEFAPAFDRMAREKVSAVLVFPDPFTIRHRPALSAALGRYRLPALWGAVAWPLQGAVLTSGFNVADQPRRAAEYMDRILKGAAPGELPFQQPTKIRSGHPREDRTRARCVDPALVARSRRPRRRAIAKVSVRTRPCTAAPTRASAQAGAARPAGAESGVARHERSTRAPPTT